MGLFILVAGHGVKSLELHSPRMAIGPAQDLHEGNKDLCSILGCYLPAVILTVLAVGGQAVVIAGADQVIIAVVHCHLLRDLLLLPGRQLSNIQLIAEGACERYMAPGLEGGDSAHSVIRAVGNVCPHSGQGVDQGRSLLNGQALNGIGIVGAPDLGAVIEHTRVKSRAAAGAVLDQQFGVMGMQPLLQLIDSQDIAMVQLSLGIGRQAGAAQVRQLAVHIPLYVCNVGTVQNCPHPAPDIFQHLLPGQIQHQLIARQTGRAPRYLNRPVRVGTVKVGVRGDHLRLHPDAEFHAQLIDLSHQTFQTAGKLFLIDEPVSQGAVVVIAVSEPAVVHHQHLNAQFGRPRGNGQKLFGIEIEVGALPVVDEDGALSVPPDAADQMAAVQVVECPGHMAQAGVGIHHHYLRGLK